jgi:hypothetical protein
MAKDIIGYEALFDAAHRGVVRAALCFAQEKGMLGSHHFYLTFKTQDPGVEIPDFLKERYPDEMTIVLQNQYWDLKAGEDKFEVTLSFQKLPATLVVPYAAMTAFADPGVQFGLQFRNASPRVATALSSPSKPDEKAGTAPEGTGAKDNGGEADVVSLDKFRKK